MKNRGKETLIYFIGTIMLSILNFIISILYGNMFTTNDFGVYSLVYSSYALISQLLIGWVSQSIIRFYKKNNDKTLKSSIYTFHIIASFLLIILFNIIIIFAGFKGEEKILYILFTITYFFESFILITNTLLRSENNSKQYSKNVVLNGFLKIISLLVLYYIFGFTTVIIIVISLLLSEIIQTLYLTYKYKLYNYISFKSIDKTLLIEMFKYGYPLIGVSITSWVLNVSDRFIIKLFYNNSEVGIYSYSYTIANSIIMLVIQFIMLGAYPNIINTWENNGKKETIDLIKNYLNVYLLIVVPMCIGFVALGSEFFRIVINKTYYSGYITFIITAIGIALLGLSQYTNKIFELHKKTKTILWLNIMAAVINIILNFIFIPIYGPYFGAVTTGVSFIIYIIISALLGKKYLKLEIDIKKTSIITISSIIMFLVICIYKSVIGVNSIYSFGVIVLLGIMIYFYIILKFDVINIKELWRIFKNDKK